MSFLKDNGKSNIERKANKLLLLPLVSVFGIILISVLDELGVMVPNWVVVLVVLLGFVLFAPFFMLISKQPDKIVIADGTLYGAHRYNMMHDSIKDFTERFTESIVGDGYEYIGKIQNPFNATMRVYVYDPDL